jgi:hypothetical protein
LDEKEREKEGGLISFKQHNRIGWPPSQQHGQPPSPAGNESVKNFNFKISKQRITPAAKCTLEMVAGSTV